MNNKQSHIYFILGVVAISFSPLVVKLVTFTTSVSAFYRSFYAAIFFSAAALFGNRQDYGKENTNWIMPSVYAGLFLGIDLIIWHKTIVFLGAGPATFLGNSQIIFMTLFAALVFKEKIPFAYYVVVSIVVSGLYLLLPQAVKVVSKPQGYVMGLVVGFTYAGMLICLRYAKTLSKNKCPELFSLAIVFWVSAFLIFLYVVIVEHGTVADWNIKNHSLMLLAAFFCQTLGWFMINSNITKIPAHEASLLLMLQPVLATLWGSVFFSEPQGAVQIAAMSITLTAIAAYQLKFTSKNAEVL